MKWRVVKCARCGGNVIALDDVADRVERGESFLICEGCIDSVGGVKGPEGEANPLRPPVS